MCSRFRPKGPRGTALTWSPVVSISSAFDTRHLSRPALSSRCTIAERTDEIFEVAEALLPTIQEALEQMASSLNLKKEKNLSKLGLKDPVHIHKLLSRAS